MGGAATRIAKITPPSVTGALLRTRLFRHLDQQRGKRVLWLEGPPGAGKTTLAATYVTSRRLPAVWCALDGADADLATFFHYLGLACRGLGRSRRALPAFTHDRRLGLPVFTRIFFEQVGARLPPRGVVVLDNYQDVPDGAPLGAVLALGLASLRAGQRLLVLSREPPPANLARLEIDGSLVRIQGDELRLTLSETRAIVRRRRGNAYGARDAQRGVHERTGGWVAGLLLFLEQARAVPAERWETPAQVFQYLGVEYLDQLPAATRELLCRVAIPPRVSAEMAAVLADHPDAGAILEGLGRRGAFVTRRAGRVYELHPLLRELCLSRGERALGAAEVDRLRRLAARLCTEAGHDEAAVELHTQGKDWLSLCALACARAPSLLAQGRDETLHGWLSRVPEALLRQEPWAGYWRAAARLYYDPLEARAWFIGAYERFGQLGDRDGQTAAWSGVVNSYGLAQDDMHPLDSWLTQLDALLPEGAMPPPAVAVMVMGSVFTALNFRQPHHPKTEQWAALGVELLASRQGDPAALLILAYVLTSNAVWLGNAARVRLGGELFRRATHAAGAPPVAQVFAWTGEAMVAAYEGDPVRCLASVEKGLVLAREMGIPYWDGMLHAYGAYAALTVFDVGEAGRRVDAWRTLLQPGLRPLELAHHDYVAAWHALVAGDLARALEVGRRAREMSVALGTPYPEAMVELVLAEVHALRAEAAPAARALTRAREVARATGSHVLRAHCSFVGAHLALARGDRAGAERDLRDALGIARQEGLTVLNTFAAPAHVVGRLCQAALESGIEVETVRALLRARPPPPETFEPPASLADWPWLVRVHLLGGFRLELNDRPVRFSRKVQRRPLELLQILVTHGGIDVPEGRVMDLLWPESEGDKAVRAFGGALHRLRAILGDASLVRRQGGLLTLDKTRIYSDFWAASDLFEEVALRRSRGEPEAAALLERQAKALLRGPHLPESFAPWLAPARERIAACMARLLT